MRRDARSGVKRYAWTSSIGVRSHSMRALAEEAPASHKGVDEVVAACERAGLARRVERLRPIGVIKA